MMIKTEKAISFKLNREYSITSSNKRDSRVQKSIDYNKNKIRFFLLKIDLGCVYSVFCDSTVPDELNDLLVCAGFLGEGVSLVLILRGEQLFATWSLCNVKNERI